MRITSIEERIRIEIGYRCDEYVAAQMIAEKLRTELPEFDGQMIEVISQQRPDFEKELEASRTAAKSEPNLWSQCEQWHRKLETEQPVPEARTPAKTPKPSFGKGRGMPKEVAEPLIRDYLREADRERRRVTVREVAAAVGCSAGVVCKSNPWTAHRARTRHVAGEESTGPAAKVVGLSDKLLATTAGGEVEPLDKLIADHERDYEPSPLYDDPRQRRGRKVYPNR
ncbi:MAG: hypothetical protein ACFCVE_15405 [Phycisphaerae bacterium]